MNYDDVVLGRRSIRAFKSEPVPRKVLEEVIGLATRAPSSMNSQPWHLHVLTGEPLDCIRAENTERMITGVKPSKETRDSGSYEGQHRHRQVEIAVQLFEAMGIARDDKEKRQDWVLRGFRQFDAPVSIVVTYDRQLREGDIAQFDCGALVNGLVNAAWSRGLGCVVNSQGIMHSPVVREHAGIPDDQVIIICVAMGYPDESFPANAVVSRRREVTDVARFVGFVE
ncbi:oxidoreductase [Halopseudomonas oceani]|uniref:Nitroreductase n=1 Tax=Halopseudomonas oceani TaxID=1708783 RepID=A0A2P4EWW8_9GAMM|nr:nitroreductase [Halopseudomonas oceani]POB04486.1 nitroreductase [Halopseudomonas oceani]GGE39867.1 oxidoreductase [Halopseudomonas oceani]